MSDFKQCPMCGKAWENRTAFLNDESLVLEGYGADMDKVEAGLLYFTHRVEGCLSTMALEVTKFFDLYGGEKYSLRRTGEEDCPGFCMDRNKLDRCSAKCEYAFVREIIRIIQSYRDPDLPFNPDQIVR